ncbi:hypothetical protein GNI_118720 [Gregarina niphandrodes]|uniref:Uncharacterized protein n=1 Tax=Gregarina niphandrodes TaxID=110365 RepID=A0A023B2K2_GRENI|nr:hypothetical protein GNI_118720 [Gregarina niphandrodes]EZG55071.1 hypothetical protein GNI_118720 [Gregarina niphandrodes]|eukprot:XP_011131797.1 hypothetical protein GNI_118720 [Gregarina niphandrodes]
MFRIEICSFIFNYLELKDALRLALAHRRLTEIFLTLTAHVNADLSFSDRQAIRRQIFQNEENKAIPSHFTHISVTPTVGGLSHMFHKPRRVAQFIHRRSAKEMKLYHPYFYRYLLPPMTLRSFSFSHLPLALHPRSVITPPVMEPQNIPMPHDLSLLDMLSILCVQHETLKKFVFSAYDSCPIPWNTTPSRVCPRDVIDECIHARSEMIRECFGHLHVEEDRKQTDEVSHLDPLNSEVDPELSRRYQIRVWCPECRCSRMNHDSCWMKGGRQIKDMLLTSLDSEEDREDFLRGWEGAKGLNYPNLEHLEFSGWGLSNFLALVRILGIARFPKLKTLILNGTLIMSPSLTDPKNALPRPKLKNEGQKVPSEPEKLMRFMQTMSFQYSPFARHHSKKGNSDYWMSVFNGGLWTPDTFPQLRRAVIRVGNFDDAARWITPLFENCLAFAPNLEEIEFDHSIVQFSILEDPIMKFFSMVPGVIRRISPDEGGTVVYHHNRQMGAVLFPKLQVVKIRFVDSPMTLVAVENAISNILQRPIRVKTRKAFVHLFSDDAQTAADIIREWPSMQKERLRTILNQSDDLGIRQQIINVLEEAERVEQHNSMLGGIEFAKSCDWTGDDEGDDACDRPQYLASPLSPFSEDTEFRENGLLILSFDGARQQAVLPPLNGDLLNFGTHASKLLLKHYRPSDTLQEKLLASITFQDSSNEVQNLSTICTVDDSGTLGPEEEVEREPNGKDLDAGPRKERLVVRDSCLRRLDIQLEFAIVWQVSESEAKLAVEEEVARLRKHLLGHPWLRSIRHVRVGSCTRLTYEGNNWDWWERLICGVYRPRQRRVGAEGWARESKAVIPEQALAKYQCHHMTEH